MSGVRTSLRSEAFVNLVAVLFFSLFAVPGLFAGSSSPTFWFSIVMLFGLLAWGWKAARLGRIVLDERGLLVHGLLRNQFVPLEQIGGFASAVVGRGIASRREVLIVITPSGDEIRVNDVHDAPGRSRLSVLAKELDDARRALARRPE